MPEFVTDRMVDSMLTTKTHKLSKSVLCLFVMGFGVLLFSSGCNSLLQNLNTTSMPTNPNAESAGQYYVEMHPAFGQPKIFQGELDGNLTVQQALERSGATKKYRGMNIGLFRFVKESGRPLKLPVEYKYRNKQVSPDQNYALHPEDRIVVMPKSSSPLDKVMDSLGAN